MQDLISRQAVLKLIIGSIYDLHYFSEKDALCDDIKRLPAIQPDLSNMPSAVQTGIKGQWLDGHRVGYGITLHWYIYCSECLHEREDDNHDKDTPYCPWCGVEMKVD